MGEVTQIGGELPIGIELDGQRQCPRVLVTLNHINIWFSLPILIDLFDGGPQFDVIVCHTHHHSVGSTHRSNTLSKRLDNEELTQVLDGKERVHKAGCLRTELKH